jgi:hypothetical protein
MKMRVNLSLILSFSISFLIYLARNPFSDSVPLNIFNITGWLKLPGDLLVYILFGLISPHKAWQILHGAYPFLLINYFFVFVFYLMLFYFLLKLLKFPQKETLESSN